VLLPQNSIVLKRWGVILILLITTIFLQEQVSICTDTARLIQLAQDLLHHERYYKDFFDTNTPMALFLYFPVLLIAHLFSLKLITALLIYIYAAACFSLFLIQQLLQQSHSSNKLTTLLLIASAISFLLLPADAFSQREHFLILFAFPYLIEVGLLMNHSQKFSKKITIPMGLLAGIAFAIKPHFLILFFLTEGLLWIKQKKCTACFRLEVLLILAVQIAYLYALFIFTPEYFFLILPVALKIYPLITVSMGLNVLLTKIIVVMSVLTLCLFMSSPSKADEIKTFRMLFAINLVGCLFIVLLQGNSWYYHAFPAFALVFVLLCLLVDEQARLLLRKNHHLRLKDFPQITRFCITCLLIIIALTLALSRYEDNYQNKKNTTPSAQQLIQFIQINAPHQTAFFFGSMKYAYPMNIETSINAYAFHDYFLSHTQRVILQQHHLESAVLNFWINQTTHLLQKKKPDLIFIVTTPATVYGEKTSIPYIKIFSQSKAFKDLWSQYHYIKHFQDFDVYQYSL